MENTDDIRIDMKYNIKGHGKTGVQQSTFICAQPEISPYPGFTMRIGSINPLIISNVAITVNLKWLSDNSHYTDNGQYIHLDGYSGQNSDGTLDPPELERHFINNIYEDSIILNNIPQDKCHNMNTYLFCALDSSGQPFRFSEADVYYMRIYKGGTLLRSLWPVRRKSDNAIGLYDIITDHLYASQSK